MKRIKNLLFLITAFGSLALAFSGCHKEKITQWKCVLEEDQEVVLTIDETTDFVSTKTTPYPLSSTDSFANSLFSNGKVWKIRGKKILLYDVNRQIVYSAVDAGFWIDIVSKTESTMDLEVHQITWTAPYALGWKTKNYKFDKVFQGH